MKHIFFSSVLFSILFLTGSCSGGKSEKKPGGSEPVSAVAKPDPVISNETRLMLKELEDRGDYVNSQQYPSLIKASLVNEAAAGRNLVIDLRSAGDYASGHIRGSVNIRFSDLPAYFESGIKPFEYEKIIFVCGDGQLSSYVSSLLRLRGYGNVFAMRWGMSAWDRESAGKNWLAGLTGKYESALDTLTYNKPEALRMPDPATGLATGREITEAMFTRLFSESPANAFITADEVFKDPAAFFIINMERKDKYNDGHIPGAIRYKPDGTLGVTAEMASIPYDRPVVIYCGTGHNSAFATAYLRLFGYDARTLRYGNNSFMHDRMIRKKAELSWIPFTAADVNNFPVVK